MLITKILQHAKGIMRSDIFGGLNPLKSHLLWKRWINTSTNFIYSNQASMKSLIMIVDKYNF